MAHDTQIVRAKGNLKLSYGGPGPSQGKASGTNQQIKLYVRVVIESESSNQINTQHTMLLQRKGLMTQR